VWLGGFRNASGCLFTRPTLLSASPWRSRPRGLQLRWRLRSSAARRTEEIRMTGYANLSTMWHYCSDSEYEYGNEVTAEAIGASRVSYPVCGSTRISPGALAGVAEAAVSVHQWAVAHSHHRDGSESLVVGSEEFRRSDVGDHAEPGHPSVRLPAPPPRSTTSLGRTQRTRTLTDTGRRTLDTWTLGRPHRTLDTGGVDSTCRHWTLGLNTGCRTPGRGRGQGDDGMGGIRAVFSHHAERSRASGLSLRCFDT
jgi:hypothetical protein